jgi:aspartyl-tRNA(Asn)/glutamyl-tRNA(Gln) amidotransferase subunit A
MPDDALPGTTDLHFLTIAEAASLIEQRKLSPVALTRAFLDRITAVDPQLNAYLLVTEEQALDQARVAEAEIISGNYRGPMHGIPFALKDIYCTSRIRTTSHSRTRADYVPDFDATTVARLHRAGAILLGKLATHEFAHGGPSFDLPRPPARNPWNREHLTGGSSSGSGAGVAAGLAMGALGSDTGGSIRNPAALCGLAGLKPTYGLVSRFGVYTNSFSYDHAGPMTWSVEDCAIMLQTIAGHDPKDPASVEQPVPDYRAALTGSIKGLRIGVLRHLFEDDTPIAPAAKTALEAAFDVLRGLGATLEDTRIRPVQVYHDVKITGAESELYAVHEPALRTRLSDFGEDFLGRTLGALLISGADYVQASRWRRVLVAEMAPLYRKYDVLVTAGPGPAPRLDSWRTINFWQRPSLTTPFNVLGGPALHSASVSPATDCHYRCRSSGARSMMRRCCVSRTPTKARRHGGPAGPCWIRTPPSPIRCLRFPNRHSRRSPRRDEIAATRRRAGLTLNERQFQQLCATAPYVEAMVGRLKRDPEFYEEPASTVSFS